LKGQEIFEKKGDKVKLSYQWPNKPVKLVVSIDPELHPSSEGPICVEFKSRFAEFDAKEFKKAEQKIFVPSKISVIKSKL
jgi:hypothetical protein